MEAKVAVPGRARLWLGQVHPKAVRRLPCQGLRPIALFLAVTKPETVWVNSEGEVSRKSAYCCRCPERAVSSSVTFYPPGRAGGSCSMAPHCVHNAVPGSFARLDHFPSGEFLCREKAKGRWPLEYAGKERSVGPGEVT